jgi:hypothetical protein
LTVASVPEQESAFMKKAIDQIRDLSEVDYGDFKRKAGLYLNRLEQGLKSATPEVKAQVAKLKTDLLYRAPASVERVRAELIARLAELKVQ